ncbi:MAG: macro domain-containing protein [Hyphomonadaceae bacterium]|nr:macro domain-containing protein [Hyphomonadaceae bacterium]
MPALLDVVVAPIETLALDAIVNPANSALVAGGGADGAIRRAAGPELDNLLAQAGGLAEGAALITPGFRLPARWVVHTVAPIWGGGRGDRERAALLAQCYRSCIEMAAELNLRSIGFPAIGAGAYGWPIREAADIAVTATRDATARFGAVEEVVFCCFSEADASVYRARLTR